MGYWCLIVTLVLFAADAFKVPPGQGLALPVLAGAADRQDGCRYAGCPAEFTVMPPTPQPQSPFAQTVQQAKPPLQQQHPDATSASGEQLQQQSSPEQQQVSEALQRSMSGGGSGDSSEVVMQRRPLLYFHLDGHDQPCGPVSLDALSSASQTVMGAPP